MPTQVTALFRQGHSTGIKHGTVTVLFKGTTFEVTTFRTETDYSDGRRPDSVTFSPSIFDDLARRDFTINAIAYDLKSDTVNDPHGGKQDLAHGLIRAIGDPSERFREDGLRPLRACRFAAQLSFRSTSTPRRRFPGCLEILAKVSAERMRDEILKTLAAPLPSVGLLLMKETGILGVVLPELLEGVGVTQGSFHCYDVFTHSLYACDAAPRDSLILRLAALLHDVGKPRVRAVEPDGRPTFYTHDAALRGDDGGHPHALEAAECRGEGCFAPRGAPHVQLPGGMDGRGGPPSDRARRRGQHQGHHRVAQGRPDRHVPGKRAGVSAGPCQFLAAGVAVLERAALSRSASSRPAAPTSWIG